MADKTYFYRVSAIAIEGNESMKSEVCKVIPSKYASCAPSGLESTSDEWSVKLTWIPNKEHFVSY